MAGAASVGEACGRRRCAHDGFPRSSTLLIVLSYVGFVSLGLPDGLLGVATPSIRASFALAPEDIGALLVSFTAGYLVSSFNSGWTGRAARRRRAAGGELPRHAASLLGYARRARRGG